MIKQTSHLFKIGKRSWNDEKIAIFAPKKGRYIMLYRKITKKIEDYFASKSESRTSFAKSVKKHSPTT